MDLVPQLVQGAPVCGSELVAVLTVISVLPHIEVQHPYLLNEAGRPSIAVSSFAETLNVFGVELPKFSGDPAKKKVPPSQFGLGSDSMENAACSVGHPEGVVVTFAPMIELS